MALRLLQDLVKDATMPDTHDLKQLISVLRDGERFYVDAAGTVGEASHQDLFRLMAMTKREIADELSTLLPPDDRSDAMDGTWIGKVRECYAHHRAMLSRDKDTIFINELEAAEDRILAAFRDCLSTTRQRKVRKLLEQQYPRAVSAHEGMSALKRSAEI